MPFHLHLFIDGSNAIIISAAVFHKTYISEPFVSVEHGSNTARGSGLVPDPAAVPRAGNMQGQAISITASQPGHKVDAKHDPSRLCCQSAAALEIHNVPILLPEPVAILLLPHTHAAEHARHIGCHGCARTLPAPGQEVAKSWAGMR